MVVENAGWPLVDTGTNDSLANTRAALERIGLGSDAVDYVILTHIHLDHAGGAGDHDAGVPCRPTRGPSAGARHMAEPSKLIAGVSAVYGADYVRRVYGDIVPVPAARIVEAVDGMKLSLAGRRLTCLDTPGMPGTTSASSTIEPAASLPATSSACPTARWMSAIARSYFPPPRPASFRPGPCASRCQAPGAPAGSDVSHALRPGRRSQAMGETLLGHLAVLKLALGVASLSGDERHQRLKAGLTRYLLDEFAPPWLFPA